jgi:hypothetical protein
MMMKYMLQSILFSGLFFLNILNAKHNYIEFAKNEVFIPEKLGSLKLYKDNDGFHILKNEDEIYDIQNCFCDPILRAMSYEQLVNFLGRNKSKIIILTPEEFDQISQDDIGKLISQFFGGGYISVNQMDNGEYILHAKIRLPGGGWWNDTVRPIKVKVSSYGPIGSYIAKTQIPEESDLVTTFHVAGSVCVASTTAAVVCTTVTLGSPVIIVTGAVGYTGYLCYKGVMWLVKSDEVPTPPAANPPAADNKTVSPATPSVKIRIVEGRP